MKRVVFFYKMQKLYIEQIIVKGSDGSVREISPIVIKIR